MELYVPPIQFKLFSVDVNLKKICAEHSDLGNPFLRHKLYDDACDEGIALYNSNTGGMSRWHMIGCERDREGDIVSWLFSPTHSTVLKFPKLANWMVVIYND